MSNAVGYSLGCVTGVKYNLTQGEDATGNTVALSLSGCVPGCWNGDYQDRLYWSRLPSSTTSVSGTDYYGALAPTLRFQGGGNYREICPTVYFCDGPVAEGETVTKYLGRYETRWMALLVEGLIYYGRVDGVLIQTPLDLFPDPLSDTATHIALSFDANARPVFSYEDDGTIYVRRYVAGTPTTYSWSGTEPCLFFNGILDSDDSRTDVVCYYLTETGGALYARFQRDNFGVEDLVTEDPGLTSLKTVDRGRSVLSSFMVVELSGKRVFAAVYPPWPIYQGDPVAVYATIGSDISYEPITLTIYQTDEAAVSAVIGNDIDYSPITVTLNQSESTAASATINSDVSYELVIVSITVNETAAVSASIGNDVDYHQSVVNLTEDESAAVSATINSDIDYTT